MIPPGNELGQLKKKLAVLKKAVLDLRDEKKVLEQQNMYLESQLSKQQTNVPAEEHQQRLPQTEIESHKKHYEKEVQNLTGKLEHLSTLYSELTEQNTALLVAIANNRCSCRGEFRCEQDKLQCMMILRESVINVPMIWIERPDRVKQLPVSSITDFEPNIKEGSFKLTYRIDNAKVSEIFQTDQIESVAREIKQFLKSYQQPRNEPLTPMLI